MIGVIRVQLTEGEYGIDAESIVFAIRSAFYFSHTLGRATDRTDFILLCRTVTSRFASTYIAFFCHYLISFFQKLFSDFDNIQIIYGSSSTIRIYYKTTDCRLQI
jgi:hypothetical protein